MKILHLPPLWLAVAAIAAGCGSTPTSTSQLEQAREDYRMALTTPSVASNAPNELKQASEALEQANAAAGSNRSLDSIDRLAYIAQQKVALAREVAKQRSAEASAATATKERDQVRLDQRTTEANVAKLNAAQAELAAQTAQNQALQAKARTDAAQRAADEAQRNEADARARAAQLEAQLAELAAKQTERGTVITLGDVLFGVDQASLNAKGLQTVDKLASILLRHPERTVMIEGHTDSTGSLAHNQVLSERRAEAVKQALRRSGVMGDRIYVQGLGPSQPVTSNDTPLNRQLNRRVEIILSDSFGRISMK